MKRPGLHQLAELAEVIAAVGVIVSLLYVATELRQNTRAIRAGTFQNMASMTAYLRSDVVNDPTFAAILVKASSEATNLTGVETLRLKSWFAAVLRQFEDLHYQYVDGTLDPGLWKGYDRMIHDSMGTPALQAWYRAHQDEYSDGFRAYLSPIVGP